MPYQINYNTDLKVGKAFWRFPQNLVRQFGGLNNNQEFIDLSSQFPAIPSIPKLFQTTVNLIAGNTTINHNLGLSTPTIYSLQGRDSFGNNVLLSTVPASDLTNSLVINSPVALSTIRIIIIGQ